MNHSLGISNYLKWISSLVHSKIQGKGAMTPQEADLYLLVSVRGSPWRCELEKGHHWDRDISSSPGQSPLV